MRDELTIIGTRLCKGDLVTIMLDGPDGLSIIAGGLFLGWVGGRAALLCDDGQVHSIAIGSINYCAVVAAFSDAEGNQGKEDDNE